MQFFTKCNIAIFIHYFTILHKQSFFFLIIFRKCPMPTWCKYILVSLHDAIFWISCIRDCSQTLVREAWCKNGPLKIFDLCKEGLEKKSPQISSKIEFACSSLGLTHNFHGKKRRSEIFRGLKGEGTKFFATIFFLHQAPLTSGCDQSLT